VFVANNLDIGDGYYPGIVFQQRLRFADDFERSRLGRYDYDQHVPEYIRKV
jgi:hypothetical protein